MTIRKNVWLCREVHCEGEPMPETAFTLRTARSIDAQEAAEHFSQHLDEKEHGDLSDWDMTQVEMWKTIEVEESPGAWRREPGGSPGLSGDDPTTQGPTVMHPCPQCRRFIPRGQPYCSRECLRERFPGGLPNFSHRSDWFGTKGKDHQTFLVSPPPRKRRRKKPCQPTSTTT